MLRTLALIATLLLTPCAALAQTPGPGSRHFFENGTERGSRYYLQNGRGEGSLYHLDNGVDFGSSYHFAHGTKPGSLYFWRFGRDAGSSYYWRFGRDPGSEYYWRNGRGCLSEYGWRNSPQPACGGIQRSQLHLLFMLCAADLIDISACAALPQDRRLERLREIAAQGGG